MGDYMYGGNCGDVNVKGTMNDVLLTRFPSRSEIFSLPRVSDLPFPY